MRLKGKRKYFIQEWWKDNSKSWVVMEKKLFTWRTGASFYKPRKQPLIVVIFQAHKKLLLLWVSWHGSLPAVKWGAYWELIKEPQNSLALSQPSRHLRRQEGREGVTGVDQIPTVSISRCDFTPTDGPTTCLSESLPQYWVLVKPAHVYFGSFQLHGGEQLSWSKVRSQVKLINA